MTLKNVLRTGLSFSNLLRITLPVILAVGPISISKGEYKGERYRDGETRYKIMQLRGICSKVHSNFFLNLRYITGYHINEDEAGYSNK